MSTSSGHAPSLPMARVICGQEKLLPQSYPHRLLQPVYAPVLHHCCSFYDEQSAPYRIILF
ncbi:hypothetical protein KCP74_14460 [Salmonella enterica subsp. enterica]|nr:hypothetical protein KCP74_14460 [Salmonella enterica subsp. enterica]